MPWIKAVTPMSVVVARMIPSSVRKLRSLFFRSESRAMRVASQNALVGRSGSVLAMAVFQSDEPSLPFVPTGVIILLDAEIPHGDSGRVHGAGVPSAGFDIRRLRHRIHARQSLRHTLPLSGIPHHRNRFGIRAAHPAVPAGYS